MTSSRFSCLMNRKARHARSAGHAKEHTTREQRGSFAFILEFARLTISAGSVKDSGRTLRGMDTVRDRATKESNHYTLLVAPSPEGLIDLKYRLQRSLNNTTYQRGESVAGR